MWVYRFTSNQRVKEECPTVESATTWGRPTPRQSFPAYNTTPCHNFEVAEPIHSRMIAFLLIHYFTLWLWLLTFDLEHLQRITCDVMNQIWMQSSNPRQSSRDFNIWPNDLEIALSVALSSGIIFTTFDLRQLIRSSIIAFLCHAATLTFDLLTFTALCVSCV